MSDLVSESLNKKKGLGRGLGSLLGGEAGMASSVASPQRNAFTASIPTAKVMTQPAPPSQQPAAAAAESHQEATHSDSKIWMLAIDKLSSGQFQPRTHFDKEKLNELAASIKENGILQPIVVRKKKTGGFEIIAGERRWRAAQSAGMHEVPVIIRNYEDKQALELAIIENIQREDLNPIEEAEGYQRLISEFNLSQQEVATKVGKERATVANALRLLGLTAEVRAMLVSGEITSGHAKVILMTQSPAEQIQLAKRVIKEKLSVRKLEKICASIKDGEKQVSSTSKEESMMSRLVQNLAEEMQKMIGTKVDINYQDGKGKISVHFYSDEELNNIVDQLRDGWRK